MDRHYRLLTFGILTGAATAAAVYLLSKHRSRHRPIDINPSAIYLVTRPDEWDRAYAALAADLSVSKVQVIGFDCEWVSEPTNGEKTHQSVSLLQLATASGVCVLVRLNMLHSLPETLQSLLADRSILKVGVACLDDAKRLLNDHSIVCCGCLDLRHLAVRTLRLTNSDRLGLAGLSKLVLGVELDKSSRVRRSNWETAELSDEQMHYAACDALAAVLIFTSMVDTKSRSLRSGSDASDIQQIVTSICQGLVDIRFSAKNVRANSTTKGSVRQSAAGGADASRAYVVRKKPLYYNCQLRSPDGQLLCTCDGKKANWYVDKGLAEKVNDDPLIVQLKFEPSGRPLDENNYYLHEKENVCVVCGTTESYIRKNIIPREYRKHFPAMLKEHKSHDVLLMCVACHQRSNVHDNALKQRLLAQCVPGALFCDGRDKYVNDPTLAKVKSAAKALMSSSSRQIPADRLDELTDIVRSYYGVEKVDSAVLQDAVSMDTRLKRNGFEDQGELVVRHIVENTDGGLVAFERLWRQHFLDTMKPRHLPVMWSVDHSHDELQSLERDVLRSAAAVTHDELLIEND